MPEREPHPACYEGLLALFEALEGEHWAEVYVRWELALLAELGFGLDLSGCAAGGDNDQLAYVSPRRSEEHTSELQSLMRISYAVFCLKKNKKKTSIKKNVKR